MHFNELLLTKAWHFWVKNVQRSYFWQYWTSIWRKKRVSRKNDLYFQKWHEKLDKFLPKHVWKFGLLLGSFIQSRKCMSSNFTRDLCVMTIKNDVNFEQKLAGQFKTDMRNLTIFWLLHSKISIISILIGCFWPRYIMFEHRKYRGFMFDGTQDWY